MNAVSASARSHPTAVQHAIDMRQGGQSAVEVAGGLQAQIQGWLKPAPAQDIF